MITRINDENEYETKTCLLFTSQNDSENTEDEKKMHCTSEDTDDE